MIRTSTNLDKIILGVIYSRFDSKGPEPISWHPNLDYSILQNISLKSITLLAGNEGLVSDNVAVIPFPTIHLNAIIYFFEIPVKGARGDKLDATISILIEERYLTVFYKNMEMFNQITQASIDDIKTNYPNNSLNEVKRIYDNLNELIHRLYDQEQIIRSKLSQEKPTLNYKISVVGDPGVGKTTLLLKYVDHSFRELYIPTIGVQVSSKNLMIDSHDLVRLTIWDVAGQHMFGNLRKRFYIGSMGVIFVYDVSRKFTFDNIIKWWDDVNSVFKVKIGFLVGNKVDLKRDVNKDDALKLAHHMNLTYLETSARTGLNVGILFKEIAEKIYSMFNG
ncbi:MAG: GTP-binding protein [Candidatus Helarchaeota archaeon]